MLYFSQIQPDMITLDPEFVGSLAPPSKLTTAVNSTNDTPFARLPRLERLRVQGKADETEIPESSGDEGEGPSGKKEDSEAREKRKMRGKGKSMKRFLRKQRKNVIDPTAVCYLCMATCCLADLWSLSQVAVRAKLKKQQEERRVAKAVRDATGEPKKASALDRFKRNS